MEFFNKKQDVIDIELTQFGKNLISRGSFLPVFYQFFDDEIIYDYSYHGISEEQNNTEDRIFETQRLKNNHNVYGAERSFLQQSLLISKNERDVFLNLTRKQDPLIREKILKTPLSLMNQNSQDTPSFEIDFLDAKTSSTSVKFLNGEGYDIIIPQIEVSSSYTIEMDDRQKVEGEQEENKALFDDQTYFDLTSDRMTFFNKTKIKIDSENLLLNVLERNSPYETQNFEIELYEIKKDDGVERTVLLEGNEEIYKLFDIITDETLPEYKSENPNRSRLFIK